MPDENWLPFRQQAGGLPGSEWRPVRGSSFVSWARHESSSATEQYLDSVQSGPNLPPPPSLQGLFLLSVSRSFDSSAGHFSDDSERPDSLYEKATRKRPIWPAFGGQKAGQSEAENRPQSSLKSGVECEFPAGLNWHRSGNVRGNVGRVLDRTQPLFAEFDVWS